MRKSWRFLVILGLLIIVLLSDSSLGAAWSFSISSTGCKDAYMNQANATLDAHASTQLYVNDSTVTNPYHRKAWYGFAALSDTLALSAYAGKVDSMRLKLYYHRGNISAAPSYDTIYLRAQAPQPVATQLINYNKYDGTTNWQVAGANGANDTYPLWTDSVEVEYNTLGGAGNMYIKLDTASTSRTAESWLIVMSFIKHTSDYDVMVYFESSENTNKPSLEVFGQGIPPSTEEATLFYLGKTSNGKIINKR